LDSTLIIDTTSPIGTISPRLYGQFAEHLGRCCYDGLWVGTNSDIPHQDGIPVTVLHALQKMPVTLLRWPGGCYADHYHWRDGVGPAAERPRRLGMSCGLTVEDDNSFGTHEFLHLCNLLDAEPYLAGNVGTGTPQELSDWLEYCNSYVDTTLTRERRANGAVVPFRVPLWGIGNENWGCGGNFDVVTYAHEYRRYATMLRHVDPTAEFVICGHDEDWNVQLLPALGRHVRLVDHFSIHRYWTHGGAETEFSEQEYYALIAEAHDTENFVKRTAEIIASSTDGRHPIGIALDEWGVWHPEARPWGPGSFERRPIENGGYEQAGTMRDAVAAAVVLEGFHRQCSILSMANLAQIVNVLHAPVMTQGAAMWVTPTYYVFQLHKPHIGAEALPVHVENGTSLPDGSSAISATASRHDGRFAVTLINRHFDQPAQVQISLSGNLSQPTGQILSASSPREINSADNPDRVKLATLPVNVASGGVIQVELPPHSVATIQFTN
jgi:alpha-N-arabinofuranosidase